MVHMLDNESVLALPFADTVAPGLAVRPRGHVECGAVAAWSPRERRVDHREP